MFGTTYIRRDTDARKILLAVLMIAAVVLVSYAVVDSDDSDAAAADGKKYYYDQLTDFEKTIYTAAYNAPITWDSDNSIYMAKFTVPLPSEYVGMDKDAGTADIQSHLSRVMDILGGERVDMFWIGLQSGCSTMYNSGTNKLVEGDVNFYIAGLVTEYGVDESSTPKISESKASLASAINGVALEDTSTRYKTVESIHKYICGLLSYYPSTPIPDSMAIRNTATSFIGDHVVVCEGYAKSFKALCDSYNIPCIIVTGKAGTTGTQENHMWNYVQMENEQWYLVDCTWDDQSTMVSTYFLAGSDEKGFNEVFVKNSHQPDATKYSKFTLPTLSTSSYSKIEYEVTFKNYDGSTVKTTKYQLDDNLIAPANPSKPSTDTKVFTFKGWSTDGNTVITLPAKVSGNATYYAVYEEADRLYAVTFKNYDGSTVLSQNLKFNDTIVTPANPSRPSDDYYIYAFTGWNPAVPAKVSDSSMDYTFNAVYANSTNIKTVNGNFYVKSETDSMTFNVTEMALLKSGTGSLTVELVDARVEFSHEAVMTLAADQTLSYVKKDINTIDSAHRSEFKNAKIFAIDYGTNNDVFPAGSVKISVPCKTDSIDNLKVYETTGYTVINNMEYKNKEVVFAPAKLSTFAITGMEEEELDIMFFVPIIGILIFAIVGMALAYRYS